MKYLLIIIVLITACKSRKEKQHFIGGPAIPGEYHTWVASRADTTLDRASITFDVGDTTYMVFDNFKFVGKDVNGKTRIFVTRVAGLPDSLVSKYNLKQ